MGLCIHFVPKVIIAPLSTLEARKLEFPGLAIQPERKPAMGDPDQQVSEGSLNPLESLRLMAAQTYDALARALGLGPSSSAHPSPPVLHLPVWVLGERYGQEGAGDEEVRACACQSAVIVSMAPEPHTCTAGTPLPPQLQALALCMHHVHSTLWCTYRRGFPPIGECTTPNHVAPMIGLQVMPT
jgi:hypothetical protein